MARWWAAAAVTAALIVVPASPAAAATASVNISVPTANGLTTQSPAVPIGGTAQIDRDLLGANKITGLTVTVALNQRTAASCDGAGCGAGYGSYTTPFSYQPVLTTNGHYSIAVDVTAVEYILLSPVQRAGHAATSVRVAVPPAPPQGVTARANADRSVTVSWNRNGEPDIIGYLIERTDPGAANPAIVMPFMAQSSSSLTWTDGQTAEKGGQYGYTVIVVRPDGDGGVKSPLHAASAVAGVNVPAPPAPTTVPGAVTADTTTTTAAPTPPPSLDLTNFLAKATAAGATTPKVVIPTPRVSSSPLPAIHTSPPTLPDPGFLPNLPFPARAAGDVPVGGGPVLGAVHSVSAGPADSGTRTLLLPIATGLVLCLFGLHLRWFSRRPTSEWMEPLLPVLDFISGGRDKPESSASAEGDPPD